jgi:hypothetical protein
MGLQKQQSSNASESQKCLDVGILGATIFFNLIVASPCEGKSFLGEV